MKVTGGAIAALVGVAVVGYVGYLFLQKKKELGDDVGKAVDAVKKQVTETAAAVVAAVNPASDQNIAYRGASALTRTATGNSEDTFGTALWRWINPGQEAKDNAITAPTGPKVPTAESLAQDTIADAGTLGLGGATTGLDLLSPRIGGFTYSPGGAAVGRVFH